MPTSTRDRILDAAESLFFNDGIAVTGVDRVADRAGVAIATLYSHVGSKDGLLAAVLERRLRDWRAHWDGAVEAATTPEARLLAVFDALGGYRESAGRTQWCCFLATASERPRADGRDPVQDLLDRDTTLLTTRITELARTTGVPDPDELAAQVLLAYNGALTSLLRGTPPDAPARARRLAALALASGA